MFKKITFLSIICCLCIFVTACGPSEEKVAQAQQNGSLTLPFKPHNTQILYLSLLWAYFFVKFVKIMCASLR